MNAQLVTPNTLAMPLPVQYRDCRRRRVGGLVLEDAAVAKFNALLSDIAEGAPKISADQLVTLARWLQAQPSGQGLALLAERLTRAQYLRRMLNDIDWELPADLHDRARKLIDYLSQSNDLIPDETPVFGHLDDALLIELSWPTFAGEAQDFQDFCRFRVTHSPRGNAAERRLAWETSVLAQAHDILQRRRTHETSYIHSDDKYRLLRVC